MRNKARFKPGIIMYLLSLLIGLSLLAACGGEPAAPAPSAWEEGEILIGAAIALTGPFAASGLEATEGRNDYVEYLNKQGGINKHKVKVITIDDKFAVAETVAAYKKLRDVHHVHLMNTIHSGAVAILAGMAREDELPVVGTGEPTALFIPPLEGSYYFTSIPPYYQIFQSCVKWIHDVDWKGSTPPRIGTYSIDSPADVSAGKGIEKACQELGWPSPVATTVSAPGIAEATSQVMELKQADVDYVLGVHIDQPFIVFQKDAKRLGLDAKTLFHFPANSAGVIEATSAAGAGENTMTYSLMVDYNDTDIPGIKAMRDLNAELHPDAGYRSMMYVTGWVTTAIECEAIKIAMDKYGYDGLTGAAIKEGLESLKNITAGDTVAPVTTGPKQHSISTGIRINIREGKGTKPISDWLLIPALTDEEMTLGFWK